jgi:hypothetical protein
MKINNKLNAEECDALRVYNDATQSAHEKIAVDTNITSKKILVYLKYILVIVVTWICSVQYDKHHGSVINDGLSRNSIELENFALNNNDVTKEHIWRIVDEHKLLIANLKKKLNWKNETHLAVIGFITNNPDKLELATNVNPDRKNGFPFKEWHPHITQNMLEVSINAFHIESIEWVVKQPEWYININPALVDKINLFLKDYAIDKTNDKELK